jgi:hypothetical protein
MATLRLRLTASDDDADLQRALEVAEDSTRTMGIVLEVEEP